MPQIQILCTFQARDNGRALGETRELGCWVAAFLGMKRPDTVWYQAFVYCMSARSVNRSYASWLCELAAVEAGPSRGAW